MSTGTFVGGITTGVFAGGTGVLVEVGRGVLVGTGVDVNVDRTAWVRGVSVGNKVAVLVGVRVKVGVAVGRVRVSVAVSVGVDVGAVEVGKGPRSDPAVRATAVFVLFAFCRASASRGERRNKTIQTRKSRPIHTMLIGKTCEGVRLFF